DWARTKRELVGAREHRDACDVRGHQVGSELDACVAHIQREGKGAYQERLGGARYSLEQHVAAREQTDHHVPERLVLSQDHAPQGFENASRVVRGRSSSHTSSTELAAASTGSPPPGLVNASRNRRTAPRPCAVGMASIKAAIHCSFALAAGPSPVRDRRRRRPPTMSPRAVCDPSELSRPAASASRCSSGERRRRSITDRAGPNRKADTTSHTSPTTRICSRNHPTGVPINQAMVRAGALDEAKP